MKRWLWASVGLVLFLVLAGKVFASYPQPIGYVNDFADVLTTQQEQSLSQKLASYDKKTTNQIAVVTVKTTEPETIEDYSVHLFDQWKIGQKQKDNGVLMLFAMDDHHMRIEVGRGLEGDLTDIESKHILDDTIKPEFKNKNYNAGIIKGVDAVIDSIATDSATTTNSNSSDAGALIFLILLIIVIIIIVIAVSPYTDLGGSGSWGYGGVWSSGDSDSDSDGFGGFGGGTSAGGGASSSW